MPEINKNVQQQSRNKQILERIKVFAKAQVSAFTGGVTDYFIMVFVTEVFHVHYTISIMISGILGAVVNFSLNKTWTFKNKSQPYKNSLYKQLFKFVFVVLNSILLKSSGTYFITTFLKIDYKISRLIVDFFVSVFFNYTLQKHWVFKKQKTPLMM